MMRSTERYNYYKLQKKFRFFIDGRICCRCGKKAKWTAHRIANTETNVMLYSWQVVDHNINIVPVCDNTECNSSYNIGFDENKSRELYELINLNMETQINNFVYHAEINKKIGVKN